VSAPGFDLAVIGAGPAGLAGATRAASLGLSVAVFDEAALPGGQIHRAIERRGGDDDADSIEGRRLVAAFRSSGAAYMPSTAVWQVERGFTVFHSTGGQARTSTAKRIMLTVGASERPVPLPGWTLPGVTTVGAAQILLKTARIVPEAPFYVVGQGPLALLYLTQLLAKGVRADGLVLTTPPGAIGRALPHLPGALANAGYLLRGLGMLAKIRAAGIPILRGASVIEIEGGDRVEALSLMIGGVRRRLPARAVLLHEGVVPQVHMALALGAAHRFDTTTRAYTPDLDAWGNSTVEGVLIAGDAGGISGARAAALGGEIAAIGAAHALGRIDASARDAAAVPLRRELSRHTRIRPFLDACFAPPEALRRPADTTIVCRCEEKTAGDVRAAVAAGALGPNQVKSATRCGMGPCQGRQCMLTTAEIVAHARGVPVASLDPARIRPPLKPVTLGELASLAAPGAGGGE